MTIGIYKLNFKGTNKVYIGQSINIEQRFNQHKNKMLKGKASPKLQEAYNIFGIPEFEQLEETKVSNLTDREEYYITKYNSIAKGFNTCEAGHTPSLNGINNPNAKYTEEDYFCVLYYLGFPGYSWKLIESITGVSSYVISHIASQESHGWLKDKFPIEYAKVVEIRKTTGRNFAKMQGITYPNIVSPEGIVYSVEHVTNFAKQHDLLQPKLHEVLTGTRNTHKGWHLESYIEKKYPDIISPEGVIYKIPYKGLAEFARKHGLVHTNLHGVVTGKSKSHKGWKVV